MLIHTALSLFYEKNSLGDITANQELLYKVRQVIWKLETGPKSFQRTPVHMPGGMELMLDVEFKKRGMYTSMCIRLPLF